ncbi:MAG: hypothetical protein QME21_07815 [Anaerolineales bacterium]|jgi:hypothetical protein|nr:hypothetical protein [Anaerolineales bacterium]
MRWLESRILWGSLLILAGVLFLLQNLGLLPAGNLFWMVLIGVGGAIFLSIFIQNRTNWWALIPGLTLVSIALVIGLGVFAPRLADRWGGSLVLGGIGLSFALIYLVERQHWWAVIPFGVLFTLASMVALEQINPGLETPGVFFLGLSATFVLVALLPNPQGELRWAWIPAAILLAMGVLFIAAAEEMLAYIWPAALILAGLFLIYRTFRSR